MTRKNSKPSQVSKSKKTKTLEDEGISEKGKVSSWNTEKIARNATLVSMLVSICSAGAAMYSTYIYQKQADIAQNQAKIALEATKPYLVVSTVNDENHQGLYVLNQGKGNAIIDSIKINGMLYKTVVTKEVWGEILKSAGIDENIDCFAYSAIQKNAVVTANSHMILIGRNKGPLDTVKQLSSDAVKISDTDRISQLNELVLYYISQPNWKISREEILSEFHKKTKYRGGSPPEADKKCKNDNFDMDEEILKKLNRIEIEISYRSIIDDEKDIYNSKRLIF